MKVFDVMDAICKDRAKGMAFAEIATRYGLPVRFVRDRTSHIRPPRRTVVKDNADEIIRMVGFGHSQSEIARRFGVRPSVINHALKRMEWKAGE